MTPSFGAAAGVTHPQDTPSPEAADDTRDRFDIGRFVDVSKAFLFLASPRPKGTGGKRLLQRSSLTGLVRSHYSLAFPHDMCLPGTPVVRADRVVRQFCAIFARLLHRTVPTTPTLPRDEQLMLRSRMPPWRAGVPIALRA